MSGTDSLHVELKNTQPVELRDLTASLTALGQAYEDYVVAAGHDDVSGNVRLYVRELRTGSIIADLAAQATQADAFFKDIDTYAGFLASLNDLIAFFTGRRKLEQGGASEPTRKQAEQISHIVEPVVKDQGSMLVLNINGPVTIDRSVHINHLEANAVQNGVRRYLTGGIPKDQIYPEEVMYLHQMRDDAKGSAGDRGVVDRIWPRPVALRFASEEVKAAILDQPDNPFRKAFIVALDVRMVGDKPALYRVLNVQDVIDRPE